MTNAEKFEEVFGIKIDDDYPANICGCLEPKFCEDHDCTECPAFHFWEREYKNDKTK